jgi:hypothetical protein
MRKCGGEPNEPGRLVNRGRLHGGNLVLPESLSHKIQAAGERRIAEGSGGLSRKR